jgi:hypothetical protein
MKKISPLLLIAATSCSSHKYPELKYGDIVKFRFTGENTFYENACENEGFVYDKLILSREDKYVISVLCRGFVRYLTITAEDVTEIKFRPQ